MNIIGTGTKKELGFIDPNVMSDVFGAYRVMNGIEDGLTLLHSPVGCNLEAEYNQMLNVNYFSRITTTALAERDVVFGGEERLKKALYKALEVFDASLICVLESVTSRLIGEDVPGIVQRICIELDSKGIEHPPIISIKAAYLEGDHTSGYNKVLETFVDGLMERPKKKKPNAVNLMGLWPDLPNSLADALELKRLLGLLGLEVNSRLICDTMVEDIRRAPEASLNLVLSEVLGIPAAMKMEEAFGIPYRVLDYPIGLSNTVTLLKEVANFFNIREEEVDALVEKESTQVDKALRKAIYFIEEVPYINAAVVADSTYAIPISRYLLEEWAIKPSLIALTVYVPESLEVLKKVEDEHSFEANVLLRPSYHQIRKAFKELKPQLVMGGSWEKVTCEQLGLMKEGTSFIPISNYQQFGRLFFYPHPFVGFMGLIHLAEELVNERLKNWVIPQDYWQKYNYFKGY